MPKPIIPSITSMKTFLIFTTLAFILFTSQTLQGQTSREMLRQHIDQIIRPFKGTVGLAAMGLEDSDTLLFNGRAQLPMQSVFKFPLALNILSQVDKGILSLDQKINLTPRNLSSKTWSPLRDKYPTANVSVTLREILTFTVSQSDNNGCDILFRLSGGPAKTNEYIHSLGILQIAIANTEEEMHKIGRCNMPTGASLMPWFNFWMDCINIESSPIPVPPFWKKL